MESFQFSTLCSSFNCFNDVLFNAYKNRKKNHKIKKSILFKETQNSTSAAIDSLIVILQIEFMTSTSHHPSSTGMPRHCTLAESSTGHFRSVANEFEIETNTQRQECG